ncbi:cysteine proteinase [Polychaeton citri CBS 116435]|uniref:Cysteine proteinase n=1 Tax=Polychaeton citri CBS 116435 TaxID=1314669 RepID=A0A9P4Q4D2_9PEZI|nr:cysteine proteinase [Polychaeton citri CBS 116435]
MAPKTKTTKELNVLRNAVIKFLSTEAHKRIEVGQLQGVKFKRGTHFVDWNLHWQPFRKAQKQKGQSATAIIQRSSTRITKSSSRWARSEAGGRLKRNPSIPPTSTPEQSVSVQGSESEASEAQEIVRPVATDPAQGSPGRNEHNVPPAGSPSILALSNQNVPAQAENEGSTHSSGNLPADSIPANHGMEAQHDGEPLNRHVSPEREQTMAAPSDPPRAPTAVMQASQGHRLTDIGALDVLIDPSLLQDTDDIAISAMDLDHQQETRPDPTSRGENLSLNSVFGSSLNPSESDDYMDQDLELSGLANPQRQPSGPEPLLNDSLESSSLVASLAQGWLSTMAYNDPSGLRNASSNGVTAARCFRNATLQCLSHLPAFIEHVEGAHGEDGCRCVPCLLEHFIFTYWQDRERLENMANILNGAIRSWCPETSDFYMYAQNESLFGDPRDYLDMVVLESLQQCAAAADRIANFGSMFWFEYRRRYQCPQCGNIASDLDTTSQATIIVNVDPKARSATLEERLREHFSNETELRRCTSQTCRPHASSPEAPLREQKVTKHLYSMPRVMFISIDRNLYLPSGNTTVDRTVRFDKQVDMTEFTADGVVTRYNLIGVIANTGGDNLSHYIALVRNRNGSGWYLINDEMVHGYTGRLDRPALPDSPDWRFHPVLLMYEKVEGASS